MDTIISLADDIVRKAMEHSECVALFILLLLQQLALHQINLKKLDTLNKEVKEVKEKLPIRRKDYAPDGR